jgi:hypothetical protein
VSQKYGEKLAEEQEALALTADIVSEVYAIESALLRTAKLVAHRGEEMSKVAIDMARVYTSGAADRVALNARNLIATLNEPKDLHAAFDHLAPQHPINAIAARRNIAETMSEAGRYLW